MFLIASNAGAWWDTWVRAQKSEPLVKSFEAAALGLVAIEELDVRRAEIVHRAPVAEEGSVVEW